MIRDPQSVNTNKSRCGEGNIKGKVSLFKTLPLLSLELWPAKLHPSQLVLDHSRPGGLPRPRAAAAVSS